MTDDNQMTVDDLLAYLAERSKKLGQLVHGSSNAVNNLECPRDTDGSGRRLKNGEFSENFSPRNSLNLLNRNESSSFSPFLRSPGEEALIHVHTREIPDLTSPPRDRPFNSIFSFRKNGETEKTAKNPKEAAELSFSVLRRVNEEFSEKAAKPDCCLCKKPIDSPVDTFWGADPAHRSCAEAAFQADKVAGRYRP